MDDFAELEEYLRSVPAIRESMRGCQFGRGRSEDGKWWVKFSIDIDHPLAWRVVQELGHVLNYVSVESRLPTVFMPVSPPTYLNGGPSDYLAWVIECHDPQFLPRNCVEWLEGRLPQPVDDLDAWYLAEQNDEV